MRNRSTLETDQQPPMVVSELESPHMRWSEATPNADGRGGDLDMLAGLFANR